MTNEIKTQILTINGGSSSVKFACFEMDEALAEIYSGEIENIGKQNSTLRFTDNVTNNTETIRIDVPDNSVAASIILNHLKAFGNVKAIGYRVVHGMKHVKPEKITIKLLKELKEISVFDPEHLPGEIELIEAFRKQYPGEIHIACFDTSFHSTMPQVAKWIPLPRRFNEKGIQRYGFHGLSYSYLLEELRLVAGDEPANGRIIMAHLGNGSSLAAVKNGKSIDTSMSFTPAGGLLMSTRTGDLDPGVAFYLLNAEKLNLKQFNQLINHESGLLGISETSSDMRELLKIQHTDTRAAEAIDLFCYQSKKWIGSYAAALGGLDTLMFSGGIGEHASEVRSSICSELQFLGIELDESRNINHEEIISSDASRVCVRVMKTNEQLMIARLVYQTLNH